LNSSQCQNLRIFHKSREINRNQKMRKNETQKAIEIVSSNISQFERATKELFQCSPKKILPLFSNKKFQVNSNLKK